MKASPELAIPGRSSVARQLLIGFCVWTAVTLLESLHVWNAIRQSGRPDPPSFYGVWLVTYAANSVWIVITPLTVWLSRRFPLVDRRAALNAIPHVLGMLLIHVLVTLANTAALAAFGVVPPGQVRPELAAMLVGRLLLHVPRYAVVIAVIHAADFLDGYRRRYAEAQRLRAELADARMQALRMQLNPHFIFNSIHSISELVYRDPALADRSLTRLADLLRRALSYSDRHEVTLSEELEFLRDYLDIQRMRFGEALHVELDISDDTLSLAVPTLLLQPLAENAIRHGVRRAESGTLWVRARRERDRLVVAVEDDGPGPAAAPGNGIGLQLTRTRLEGLYGGAGRFTLTARPGGGARAEVELPARTLERSDEGQVWEVVQ